ncbi:ankyrin repeat and SAM domain-containing protein 4B-like [Myripristis murdjan]|uniref:Ankyrin repeat and sterile alpha motif domain containing 4B n=1 Tax=Myripristis murdjan TaxID=586833 RepID=A0A667WPY9_9TELE|nr:ankyrin repeat and SAM domain-containing protein 4B-like [Myripristis murdjan]
MSRYHKAAIDGNLDMLKEATRKDLNTRDEDGMTPTLWAAFHGHVDALQLICSRGGDPNMSDIWGNTPLHHAASNGHMHILSFLVNFGANLFALDNEFFTAMDVAASHDRMDCVRFLDAAVSQQTSRNPKRVASLKKEASKDAEKCVKLCEKVKKKHQSKMEKMYLGAKENVSVSEASPPSSVSNPDIILKPNDNDNDNDVEPGQTTQSIFNRPGFGGLVFVSQMELDSVDIPIGNNENLSYLLQSKMAAEKGDVGFDQDGDSEVPWSQDELGLDDDDDEETSPLDAFLAAISLPEFALAFRREHLDLEALMLCSDEDLKGISIQLGPRKKILEAAARRKNALENPGIMRDRYL